MGFVKEREEAALVAMQHPGGPACAVLPVHTGDQATPSRGGWGLPPRLHTDSVSLFLLERLDGAHSRVRSPISTLKGSSSRQHPCPRPEGAAPPYPTRPSCTQHGPCVLLAGPS